MSPISFWVKYIMFKNLLVSAALSSTESVDVERDANSILSRVRLVMVTRSTQKPMRMRPQRLTNGKPYRRRGRVPAKISSCIRSPNLILQLSSRQVPIQASPVRTNAKNDRRLSRRHLVHGILYHAGYQQGGEDWVFEGGGF